MKSIAKPVQWAALAVVLCVIGTTLSAGQPFIRERLGSTHVSTNQDQDEEDIEDHITAKSRQSYQSNCVNLANQQANHPQTPLPSSLDDCYQSLLANFSRQFLDDVSSLLFTPQFNTSQATELVTALEKMNGSNQQSSVAQLAVQMGYKGNLYVWERQELMRIDQSQANLHVADDYDPAIGKPLLDQLVKRQLPMISDQQLDTWFAHAILASQLGMDSMNSTNEVNLIPAPRVVPPQYSGNIVYHGGRVIDGTTNVYLIFWNDTSFQPMSPKYVSLAEQFINNVVETPLYANLKQYPNSSGQYPVTAKLAGVAVDTSQFPSNVVAIQKAGKDPFSSPKWDQEIEKIAALYHWNMFNYHNLFVMLPTMPSDLCGWHSFLTIKGQTGSPEAFVTYPFDKGRQECPDVPYSPNHDRAADVTVDTLEHELMEAASDPYDNGWYTAGKQSPDSTDEMADKCAYSPPGIDDSVYYGINPKTDGNITWYGHSYILQPEYDNYRHGCVWQGP